MSINQRHGYIDDAPPKTDSRPETATADDSEQSMDQETVRVDIEWNGFQKDTEDSE